MIFTFSCWIFLLLSTDFMLSNEYLIFKSCFEEPSNGKEYTNSETFFLMVKDDDSTVSGNKSSYFIRFQHQIFILSLVMDFLRILLIESFLSLSESIFQWKLNFPVPENTLSNVCNLWKKKENPKKTCQCMRKGRQKNLCVKKTTRKKEKNQGSLEVTLVFCTAS